MTKKKVLVCNDDGINAPGIYALATALKAEFDVTVVAPDKQMSAVGHAITIHSPLRVSEYKINGEFFGYAVSGTPADCVKLALRSLMKEQPDLIISGINHGGNTSTSIIYSGTVSAATEGTFLGIPSIAISLATYGAPDFSVAAGYALELGKLVLQKGLPGGLLLNVNVPPLPKSSIAGVKVTRMGNSIWDDAFDHRKDPHNNNYYWLTGNLIIVDDADDQDEIAVSQNYISVTPIQFDLTAHHFLEELKKWELPK
ncbi:MAG: 5'/3'-nucleotidase SurE [Bacteroidetes bacterium]|nr:5'/3'-nucleotidase SurE [Bacteroidota bacterium]